MINKLPKGWEEVPLFEYLELVPSGVKKFRGTKKYIDTGSLETGKIKDSVSVNYESKPSRANMEVKEGDIMFAKMKDTEKIYLISEKDASHIYSTGFAVLRIKDNKKLLPKFIYFLLRTFDFQRKKNEGCSGATQKAINKIKLRKLKITVPSIKTQTKIISFLEKVEQIKEWQKESNELSKNYLKSVFMKMFGDPVKNEKKFEKQLLKDVCDVRDGTHESPEYVSEGYPLVTSKNLTEGFIDYTTVKFISKEDYDKANKRSFVDDGDIIMPMIGTIGNPLIVKKERDFAIKNVALIKFNKTNISNVYISTLLSSKYFDYVTKKSKRGGTQKFIALKDIRDIPVPIPPKKMQDEFEKILIKCKQVMLNQQESTKEVALLFDSLMQKAFRGELV